MAVEIIKSILDKREIHKIHISQTVRSITLSLVSIYIPAFLLTSGFSLTQVIVFYSIFHISGLIVALTIIPKLINKYGLTHTIRLYYPIAIGFYFLLYLLPIYNIPIQIIAVVGGIALFIYYVPLNILLVKHSDYDKMGSDLATFFAMPKLFGFVGPLVGALLVIFVDFWIIFVIAMLGLILSYIPLINIKQEIDSVNISLKGAFNKLKSRRKWFGLEMLDNILEESEWFWGIYVFLLIGSLATPGIVGSLVAVGGALFLFFVGNMANKKSRLLVLIASMLVILVSIARMLVVIPLSAYIITVIGSFVFMIFVVPYTSTIYRAVKDKDSEEFIILREIPTVLGRLIVFCVVLITISNPSYFFVLPIITGIIVFLIFLLKIKNPSKYAKE